MIERFVPPLPLSTVFLARVSAAMNQSSKGIRLYIEHFVPPQGIEVHTTLNMIAHYDFTTPADSTVFLASVSATRNRSTKVWAEGGLKFCSKRNT